MTPKLVKEFVFENDLIALVQNIRFRKMGNDFQKKIKKDISLINHQIRQSLLPIKQQNFTI